MYFGFVGAVGAGAAMVWGAPGHCFGIGEAHWRLLRYQQNIWALFRQAQSYDELLVGHFGIWRFGESRILIILRP